MKMSSGFTTKSREEILEILRSEFGDRLVNQWETAGRNADGKNIDVDVEERYEELIFGYE